MPAFHGAAPPASPFTFTLCPPPCSMESVLKALVDLSAELKTNHTKKEGWQKNLLFLV